VSTVKSTDGTLIAYDKAGSGPPLILVDGALCSREFGPMPKLAPLLASRFTVYWYDRRGRGQSGDTKPYSREREIEDIDALLQAAGGSAYLVGLSSGGALALEAAASGLAATRVAAYEPPYLANGDAGHANPNHQARLSAMIEAGRRGDAVKYFMRDMVGVPGIFIVLMQIMFWVWPKLKAVAHTLPYDAAVMGDWQVPAARLAAIRVPTLAMHGSKTDPRLMKAARAVAEAVPGAQHRVLEGQTHNVDPKVLAAAIFEFAAA
jgi:pimeloyl-ACP methyl ester carboxylesterase